MSISAVGGITPQQAYQPAVAARAAEAGETPGMPDHDGDADDASASKVASPGNLSLYA
jgi:hypothetical protein